MSLIKTDVRQLILNFSFTIRYAFVLFTVIMSHILEFRTLYDINRECASIYKTIIGICFVNTNFHQYQSEMAFQHNKICSLVNVNT
jgi:hypothetical protein